MTPEQHEILGLKQRLLAQKVLLEWLLDIQRLRYASLPSDERVQVLSSIENMLQDRRQKFATLTLDQLHPAESDLHTALFQEAFNGLSKKVLDTLKAGFTPEERERFSPDKFK